MARPVASIALIAAIVSFFGVRASAGTMVVESRHSGVVIGGPRLGIGFFLGAPAPVRSHVVITSPYRSRFLHIMPHRPRVVVVAPPVFAPPVAVPPVVVSPPPVVTTQPSTVTVWVTNSNGSQSPVQLTPSGPGFYGPRNEYYPQMPTNEQLRMVYGF